MQEISAERYNKHNVIVQSITLIVKAIYNLRIHQPQHVVYFIQ